MVFAAVLLVVGVTGLVLSLVYLWGGVPGFPVRMYPRRMTPAGRQRLPWT